MERGGIPSIPIQYQAIDKDTHCLLPVSSLTFGQIFNQIEDLDYGMSETVIISYAGDENYNGFTISHKFVIDYTADLSIDDYDYGATPNLYVYVPHYGGDATLYVNGKKFKAKTNSKGIAKVTIKNKFLKKLQIGKKVKYQTIYKKKIVKKTFLTI